MACPIGVRINRVPLYYKNNTRVGHLLGFLEPTSETETGSKNREFEKSKVAQNHA